MILIITDQCPHFLWDSDSAPLDTIVCRYFLAVNTAVVFQYHRYHNSQVISATSMSVLLNVRPKCMLAASHAAPW